MVLIWDYNRKTIKRRDPRYRIWRLERLINHRLDEKIKKAELKKYWQKIKIDPDRRAALAKLLWPRNKF